MKIGIPCLKLKGGDGYAKGKHAGNAKAIACEALEERWGQDEDIDPTRSHLNTYEVQAGWEGLGFESGQALSQWWQEQADAHVVTVKGKDGVVHERKLRGDAGIGFAVIAKPESEWVNALDEEQQARFLSDLNSVMVGVLEDHGLKVQVVATHHDEQSPHPHILGYDPEYKLGKKMGLKLFRDFNKEVPERMRELGWSEVENVAAYDPEKVEDEIAELTKGMDKEQAKAKREEYMHDLVEQKKARKKKSGRSSKRYKTEKDEERARLADQEAAIAEQRRDHALLEAKANEAAVQAAESELETIEIDIGNREANLGLLDADIAERRAILDGDDEYLGLDEEIAEKRKELEGLQSQIDQAEARGYADGYASGEDVVKKAEQRAAATQQRLEREISATQDARKTYEAAAGSVEGLSVDEVVKATFEEAEAMTAPKMRASMTGGKAEQEKPSILHQAVQRVVQWFGSLNVNGQPMAEVIAQRVRQRLLQRQQLVKDNVKVREFERIEAEQGKANPDEDMTL